MDLSLLERFASTFWMILCDSAPALLIGFFLAGLLAFYIPTELVLRHLRARKFSSIFKASAAGVPLPLCSCSVIPVAMSLRKAGASRGATTSFMISTPEIGVDSALLTNTFFGPFFTVYRIAAAFCTAALVGWIVERFGGEEPVAEAPKSCHSCCSDSAAAIKPALQSDRAVKVKSAFRYAFISLVDDLAALLFIGFFISAAVLTFLPDDFFSGFLGTELFASEWSAMLIALFISFPAYVCATASTPLVAALFAKGFPIGAGVVFLLAGPASNIATILALKQMLGARSMWLYVVGVGTLSLVFGAGIVLLLQHFPSVLSIRAFAGGHVHVSPVSHVAGLVLSALLGMSLLRRLGQRRPATKRAVASGLA